jgi:hypothetical protein
MFKVRQKQSWFSDSAELRLGNSAVLGAESSG